MKPGDFYVGVIDFFSILLPGALLAGMIAIFTPMPAALDGLLASEGAKWTAFALASYALGHSAFLLSAALDKPFDDYRKRKWPDEKWKPFRVATALRCRYFNNRQHWKLDRPMNTFSWAKSVLAFRAPAALAEVNRYEADSKFFRSLVIVLPLAGAAGSLNSMWPLLLPAAMLASWQSFRIYAKLRHKSTEWAYIYVIVLDRLGGLDRTPPAAGSGDQADSSNAFAISLRLPTMP